MTIDELLKQVDLNQVNASQKVKQFRRNPRFKKALSYWMGVENASASFAWRLSSVKQDLQKQENKPQDQ